jgi:MFS family permease
MTPDAPRYDPYAAFRVPNFVRYLLGAMLLQIGMGAQGLAIGYDIYQRTNQPLALGLAAGVQAAPMLLLSLPAGWLADRFDRRRIIAFCLSGLCSAR